jgi:hypothetical protein
MDKKIVKAQSQIEKILKKYNLLISADFTYIHGELRTNIYLKPNDTTTGKSE